MKQAKVINEIKVATTQLARSTEIKLKALKIPASILEREPADIYYPLRFSPSARMCWSALFHSALFVMDMKAIPATEDKWQFAVNQFTAQCEKERVNPFKQRATLTTNNAVREILHDRRIKLKRYLDVSRLFADVKIIQATAKHKYEVLYTGNLKITASVQFEHYGKDVLVNFLRGPLKMVTFPDGFGKALQKNLVVSVTQIRNTKATIQYSMEIKPPFYVPETKTTKADRHDWFDKEFYNPMVRNNRLDNVISRLKF